VSSQLSFSATLHWQKGTSVRTELLRSWVQEKPQEKNLLNLLEIERGLLGRSASGLMAILITVCTVTARGWTTGLGFPAVTEILSLLP
jgi:hypothetical protein